MKEIATISADRGQARESSKLTLGFLLKLVVRKSEWTLGLVMGKKLFRFPAIKTEKLAHLEASQFFRSIRVRGGGLQNRTGQRLPIAKKLRDVVWQLERYCHHAGK